MTLTTDSNSSIPEVEAATSAGTRGRLNSPAIRYKNKLNSISKKITKDVDKFDILDHIREMIPPASNES